MLSPSLGAAAALRRPYPDQVALHALDTRPPRLVDQLGDVEPDHASRAAIAAGSCSAIQAVASGAGAASAARSAAANSGGLA